MTSVKYTGMAYKSADDMVMGTALHPVSEGFGLKIGAGQVVPEINYAPRPGTEKDPAKLRKEYVDYITTDNPATLKKLLETPFVTAPK